MASLAIRDNNGIDINDAEIRKTFPAVFNKRRSTNVSEDYQMYDSHKVVDIMQSHGLRLVALSQEKMGWSEKRQPHTQIHTMRFMSPEVALRDFGVGDSRPEVVVMNSHDGRCTFKAMAGVFRLVCSNGMIIADSQLGSIKRRHYGEANAFAKVQEILADLPEAVNRVSGRIADWSALDLSPRQQVALAQLMMKVRGTPDWLRPEEVLEARRDGERVDSNGRRDLWTTFNVLQESLTSARITHEVEGGRARSINPITHTVNNTRVNAGMWAEAEAYFDKRVNALKGDEAEAFAKLRAEREKKAKPVMKPLQLTEA